MPSSVFIVEDDEAFSEAISSVLTESGYDVRSLRGAREALAELQFGPTPDLILLDLRMPQMTGWEFRVEQRLRAETAAIPVIAMSADGSPQARAIDADAYLHKPFDAPRLLATVERVLAEAERARVSAHSAEFERMRAVGLLASGVAHEINNPLTFLAGNADLIRKMFTELAVGLPPDTAADVVPKFRQRLDHVDEGVERIASVVRGVSVFAHPAKAELSAVNVCELVTSTLRLVSNALIHRAQLETDLQPVPLVMGNKARLGQAFLNLMHNAIDAIPEGAAATNRITVSTRPDDGRVCIEVIDTGCGMDASVLARAFDPFFTTKAIGRGMGLGLSISHSIIAEMGGVITVSSTVGKGTMIRIEVPVASMQCISPRGHLQRFLDRDARSRRAMARSSFRPFRRARCLPSSSRADIQWRGRLALSRLQSERSHRARGIARVRLQRS